MSREPDEDARLVEAAFVFAWEWSMRGGSDVEPGLIEDSVYALRRTISLDRAGAQAILRRADLQDDSLQAALVLVYEGVGGYRREAGYAFTLEDLKALARVRDRMRISFREAVGILRAWRECAG